MSWSRLALISVGGYKLVWRGSEMMMNKGKKKEILKINLLQCKWNSTCVLHLLAP
jgi:hypothetical protein